jgi:hypothetical protein
VDGDGEAAAVVVPTASGKNAAGGDPLIVGESDGGARTPTTATPARRATSPRAPMATTVRRSDAPEVGREAGPERGFRETEAVVGSVCLSRLVELGSIAQS